MDIYTRKSRWKVYLAVAGVFIVLISLVYTNYLASRLADEERKKTELYVRAQEELSDFDEEDLDIIDVTLHNQILTSNTTIPVIIVDDRGNFVAARNFGEDQDLDAEAMLAEVEKMKADGFEPIEGFAYFIYYKESTILTMLRYYPFVQLLLIGAFILFGYTAFNSARRAEQNRVWVGMAKETAHQLGTPISAIIAWIEHLKLIRENDLEVTEVAEELRNDVTRLELIADRFSKIGSAPNLEPINVYQELDQCRIYMERRASRKVSFHFPAPDKGKLFININPHLFDWVIENLLRNALDAMEGKGQISAAVYEEGNFVLIDITDTGKGIPTNRFKTIFRPGFTTKKRGWGLGLSLAKRIIEEYHSGKIFVKNSTPKENTTFTIRLPKTTPPASDSQVETKRYSVES